MLLADRIVTGFAICHASEMVVRTVMQTRSWWDPLLSLWVVFELFVLSQSQMVIVSLLGTLQEQ